MTMRSIFSGETPLLIFNTGKDDKKAVNSVKAAGIPCEFIGSLSEKDTPMLFWHYRKFTGFREIKRLVQSLKED